MPPQGIQIGDFVVGRDGLPALLDNQIAGVTGELFEFSWASSLALHPVTVDWNIS